MRLRSLFLAVLGTALALGSAAWLAAPLGARPLLESRAEAPPLIRPRLAPLVNVAEAARTGVSAVSPVDPATLFDAPLPGTPALPKGWQSTLLVGLDRRPDARGAGLADTVLVAVLDDESGRAGLISVPRDLWVTIPEHGDDRINTIPLVARRQKRDVIELFQRVLEDTLGLSVSHGVVVDLGVLERAVDLVGGVEVDVPCPILDSFHDSRVEGGRRRLELEAGKATLDGTTAAMYVRSRHGRSDFGRSRHQQAVLLGLRDRVLEQGGWLLLPDLHGELERSVQTNLRRYELINLGRRALGLDRDKLHGLVLNPPLTTGHRTEDGKSVLLPDHAAIAEAVARLFDAPAPGEPIKAACPPADAALRGR